MMSSFLYYFIYSSAFLLFSLGFENFTDAYNKPKNILLDLALMLFSVLVTVSILYLLNIFILIPGGFSDIIPFAAVLVFALIRMLVFILFSPFEKKHSLGNLARFSISFLFVLLCLFESSSFLDCLVTGLASILSYFLFVIIVYAIEKRIEISKPDHDFKSSVMIYMSFAILIICLFSWNLSWIAQEVLR